MERFDDLWNEYIKPMQGKNIYTVKDKKENLIQDVTNDYLIRISSNGKKSPKISKVIFEEIYSRLSKDKQLTRTYINENYKGRRSSIIIAVLCKLPYVSFTINPIQLHFLEK
jgi:hypothetical protein